MPAASRKRGNPQEANPEEEDEAPEEVPATRANARREPRRKATAVEIGRAVSAKRQEAISAGLRDAARPDADALPTELLEQVADVDMQAKPADTTAEERREARMAAARTCPCLCIRAGLSLWNVQRIAEGVMR
jgi:hypothetical protein